MILRWDTRFLAKEATIAVSPGPTDGGSGSHRKWVSSFRLSVQTAQLMRERFIDVQAEVGADFVEE